MAAAGGMTTDPVLPFQRRASGSEDLVVDIAAPSEYAEIEAVSRAADRHEVFAPLTARLLRWFLDDNPSGQGFVVVARDRASHAIIGHFVFYRWVLRRQTAGGITDVPSALYVRLYVDRSFRRRGIFAAMTRFGLDRLASMGITMAYTAPNPRSSPGFIKFGMQHVGPVPFRLRPAMPGWRWLGGKPPRGISVERRDRFDATFDHAIEAALPPTVALWSSRSAALMNWRYPDRPDASYEIRYLTARTGAVGFIVTRRMAIKGQDVIALCDFWVAPGCEHALRVGVEDVLAHNRGVRAAIAIGTSAAPFLPQALARAGFVSVPAALLPQPVLLFGGAVGASELRLPPIHAWHVTPYDWDVF
jgi:GNAT superfamily N-acetyltransferase